MGQADLMDDPSDTFSNMAKYITHMKQRQDEEKRFQVSQRPNKKQSTLNEFR